jgi:anti-sigma factor RsiW
MNHQDIQETLSEYYDGRLAPGPRSEIETHLKGCGECRDLLAGWQKASAAFLKPLQAQASEAFIQNVMRKIRTYEPQEAGIRWPQFLRWAAPALALSMGAFTLVLMDSLEPAQAAAETVLLEEREPSLASDWLANPPDEDQILDSIGVNV